MNPIIIGQFELYNFEILVIYVIARVFLTLTFSIKIPFYYYKNQVVLLFSVFTLLMSNIFFRYFNNMLHIGLLFIVLLFPAIKVNNFLEKNGPSDIELLKIKKTIVLLGIEIMVVAWVLLTYLPRQQFN